jgi:hypothetical protein
MAYKIKGEEALEPRPDTDNEDMEAFTDADKTSADGPMSASEVERVLGVMLNNAANFIDREISPMRAEAEKFYKGEPFGNEEKGRSQVVSTDVRDTTLGLMPSMLRIFHGSERPVEVQPSRPYMVREAEQATDYLYHIYENDNDGFMQTQAWLHDGFVKTTGFVKYWWEETIKERKYSLTGLLAEQVQMLAQQENVEYEIIKTHKVIIEDKPVEVFDCEVTEIDKGGRARFKTVPPESIMWNRDARSLEEASIVSHREIMRVGDAYEMGYASWDELIEHAGSSSTLQTNPEQIVRFDTITNQQQDDGADAADPSSLAIEINEVYSRLDVEGKHRRQLRKFICIGSNYKLVGDGKGEVVNEIPIICFVPYPIPHTLFGQSVASQSMDIQRIKSALLRGNLDSLGLALHPRTWVVEGQVYPKDVLNTEIGAIIRMKQPNMAGEFMHNYVGKDAFPLMEYMDKVLEDRTGRSDAAKGLDADSLQSSTKQAVAATINGAQERVELLARVFAETAFKKLFKGLFGLIKQHQDGPRMVRLRGEFVPIDPRPWDSDMDVIVKVGLGRGMTDDKLARLGMIRQLQEQVLTTLGPGNPLVTLAEYRNTLAKIITVAGELDVETYLKRYSTQQADADTQKAAQQPPQPSPEMIVAQSQAQKDQAETQLHAQKNQMEVQKMNLDHQHKMAQLELERELKQEELRLKYAQANHEVALQVALKGHIAEMEQKHEAMLHAHDAAMEKHKHTIDSGLKEMDMRLKAAVAREHNADKIGVQKEANAMKAAEIAAGGSE